MMEQMNEIAALMTIYEKASALGEPFKNIRDAAFRKLAEIEKQTAETNVKAKETGAKEAEHEAPKSKGRY